MKRGERQDHCRLSGEGSTHLLQTYYMLNMAQDIPLKLLHLMLPTVLHVKFHFSPFMEFGNI